MDVTALEQRIEEILADDKGWTWTRWDEACRWRGVDGRQDYQLVDVAKIYEAKRGELLQVLRDHEEGVSCMFPDDRDALEAKLLRIADKWKTVLQEIEGRSKGFFNKRKIHFTDYFCDPAGGNDGNTGLNIGQAWLNLERYTETLVKIAGDRLFVRANTTDTQNASDLEFDESGNRNVRISIIGCDSTVNDPWGDGSDVKPVVDFAGAAFQALMMSDDFWYIERIGFKRSDDTNGNMYIYVADYGYFKGCEFYEHVGNRYGAYVRNTEGTTFEDCSFIDNGSRNANLNEAWGAKFVTCTFNGGGINNSDVGIYAGGGSDVTVIDSSFGQSSAHSFRDIDASNRSAVRTRNTLLQNPPGSVNIESVIFHEDYQQVAGAQHMVGFRGDITKDTGVTRSGGASSSAKMMVKPNYCGLYQPLVLNPDFDMNPLFKIWCAAGVAKTLTVYIRSYDAWGTYPTADELYLEVSYLNHAVNPTRATVRSTQVLSDASTWVPFSCTFTPLMDGFIYANVFLGKYEWTKGCYVDIRPIMSD